MIFTNEDIKKLDKIHKEDRTKSIQYLHNVILNSNCDRLTAVCMNYLEEESK